MKTALVVWLACSALAGWRDAELSAIEGDDRPWLGRAAFALIVGATWAVIPGVAAVMARLP